MRTRITLVAFAVLLGGCAASAPRQYMTSEYDDDKTCRSFMKHKASDDDSTYQDCRKNLVDIANMKFGPPSPSNVTIIVNQ
jgi:hypothetical protein